MIIKLHFARAITLSLLLASPFAMSGQAPTPAQGPNVAMKNNLCRAPSDARQLGSDRRCPYFGHTWTREDLERTGATTVADALRELDPSVTIVHH
jgi:hypothetical protein